MTIWLRKAGLFVCTLLLATTVVAQELDAPALKPAVDPASPEVTQLRFEINARMNQFKDDLNQLLAVGQLDISIDGQTGVSKGVIQALENRMKYLNQTYNSLDVKWTTYSQAQQMDIANDEALMTQVAAIEELKQTVKDTLDYKTQAVEAIVNFANADKFIISHVSIYKDLYKKASRLAMVKQLAPQLEKVKAKEQVIFADLQAKYDQAKAASELVPRLKGRMIVIDEQFVLMKNASEKVQALEYKPFFERIKNYLLGLAAVSVIMLFVNTIATRIKAYREKVAAMKKYQEMMNKQGNGPTYPTI